ncbi:hypothetical protein Pcinc_044119 [Petrolisthes cinctipes]|uniref:Uncharacterized protein n=1 Tax=Petrolisthes cinctipes TaxID=88211 RepID=A0AAE1BE96_PETCI|nr:hypothetical protein Pcinc_044119 [Petrolisthes cinctipes]
MPLLINKHFPNLTRTIMKMLRRLKQKKFIHPSQVSPFPRSLLWSYEEAQNAYNERVERYRAEGGTVLTLPFCYVEWSV